MNNDILDDNMHESPPDLSAVRYAGFWVRVGASLLDSVVLLPLVGLNYYNSLNLKSLPIAMLIAIASAVYKPLMEYKYGATVGKMAVKIKVVNYNLQAITLEQTLIRYLPWLLSTLITMMATVAIFQTTGFMEATDVMTYGELVQDSSYMKWMQFAGWIVPISAFGMVFNPYRQAVHDQLAKTFCIYVPQ